MAGTTALVTANGTYSYWSSPERPLVSADGKYVVFTDSDVTYADEIATAAIVGSTGFFMTTTGLSADAAVAIGGASPVAVAEIAWPLQSSRADFRDSGGLIYLYPSEPVIAADASAVFLSAERVRQPYPNYGKWYSTYWYGGYSGGLGFWRTWLPATYRVDLATLEATILPLDAAAPQAVSADGRYLTYSGSVGAQSGLDRYDTKLDAKTLAVADPFVWSSALSEDGLRAVFLSYQSTLVPHDTNGTWDLFLVELPDAPHDR